MKITDTFRKLLSPKLYASFYRLFLNLWPCIRGGGGKVTYIAPDFRKLQVRLKLRWRTRNLVGTIYGGSFYASTDPMFMLMLMEILGKDFVVWDKGCTIKFKRPAKVPLTINFEVTPEMEKEVRERVARENEITFAWPVAYKDEQGRVYCEFEKVLYVAKKEFYKEKLRLRDAKAASQTNSAAPGGF